MSKLIMWNLISLDGFFEGVEPWSLEWFHSYFDGEMEQHVIDQLRSTDMLFFGRKTYEGMAAHWTTAQGEVAEFMNRLPKVVFSRTLDRADWQNTTLVKSDVESAVGKLKAQGQANIFVFGSADLSATLMRSGLFDEYRLGLVPVIRGSGKTLFGRDTTQTMKLLEARPLASGCVILRYQPLA